MKESHPFPKKKRSRSLPKKRSPVDSKSRPGPGAGAFQATPRHHPTSSPHVRTASRKNPDAFQPTHIPSTHASLRIGCEIDSNGCVMVYRALNTATFSGGDTLE